MALIIPDSALTQLKRDHAAISLEWSRLKPLRQARKFNPAQPRASAGQRQLHEWEEQAIKRLKLEKYWQPAPYPFERMS